MSIVSSFAVSAPLRDGEMARQPSLGSRPRPGAPYRVLGWMLRRAGLLAAAFAAGLPLDAALPESMLLPPSVTAFARWTDRYVEATEGQRGDLLAEGVRLARERRPEFALLLRTDPARALASAVPVLERECLPAAIIAELEAPVSGFGELSIRAAESRPGLPPTDSVRRWATVEGRTYEAFVYGRRLEQTCKRCIPLDGVALDGVVALRDTVLHFLDAAEVAALGGPIVDLAGFDPAPNGAAEPAWAQMAGRSYRFASPAAREAAEQRLEAAETGIGLEPAQLASVAIEPGGGSAISADHVGRVMNAWTQGTKKVLVLLVDFSDLPGTPADPAAVRSTLELSVAPFYAKSSYGRTSLVCRVADRTYRLPRTAAAYATGGLWDQLHADASTAATADFDVAAYDRVIVGFKSLDSSAFPGSQMAYAGLSDIGGKRVWVNGTQYFNTFLLKHELGHTYGLLHAELWKVNDGDPISPTGVLTNQGDVFDVMGSSLYLADALDFNPVFKAKLGWLDTSQVALVTTSGTYRVHAFDTGNSAAAATQVLALRIDRNSTRSYWVACRRNYPDAAPMQHGAYVVWDYRSYRAYTALLDMTTPGTDLTDAALGLGRTFTDAEAGISIRPLSEGGTEPNRYLDVQVTLTAKPPAIIAQPAGRSVNPGADVSFTVSATSTPPPSYQWKRAGVAIPGATGTALILHGVQAVDAGSYSVTVTNSAGTVDSAAAALIVAPQPPVIIRQPENRLAAAGTEVTFAVEANSASPLTYQWFGPVSGAVPGATNTALTLTNVQSGAAGTYSVLVSNSAGFVWSSVATLSVGTTSVVPVVTSAPADIVVSEGATAVFSIAAVGAGPLQYVWLKDGAALVTANATLELECVTAADAGRYSCRVINASGSTASQSATLTVLVAPKIVRTPEGQAVAPGGAVTLEAVAEDGAAPFSYRWYHDGQLVAGATGPALALTDVQPGTTGFWVVEAFDGTTSVSSAPAIVGVVPVGRTAGSVATRPEWQNIRHPNGNIYDQFLLTGTAGTITADPGQIARISFLDPQNDIVQLEMSGAGALTVQLAAASGPMAPALYNQAGVSYMRGSPLVVLAGADASTHVSIYSVGRLTNPGVTRADVVYDEWADVRAFGVLAPGGALGGLHMGNARYSSDSGIVGLYAPTVATSGVIAVHDIAASQSGQPMLRFAPGGTVAVRIAGGGLAQPNARPIDAAGLIEVTMEAGQGSSGQAAPAQVIRGLLRVDGVDVTNFLVGNP